MNPVPVVGMHFRPPASAILRCLPAGCPLLFERDPTNEYDANAIKVNVATSSIPSSEHENLACLAMGYGHSLEEILAKPIWMLGYIARGEALKLAPQFDGDEENEADQLLGVLNFDIKGKPIAILHWQSGQEPDVDDASGITP